MTTTATRTTYGGDPSLPVFVEPEKTTGWWGMVLVIVTELALFGSLLAAYFYLRFTNPTWPLGGLEKPDLTLGGIGTVFLLGSSIPMWLGDRAIKRGDVSALKLWFPVAFVMAAIFLGLEVYDWGASTFTLSTNVYGSLFFVITGIHAMHVVIGLLMNAHTQARTWLGHFDKERSLAVGTVSLYWHFVDVIWIFIFLSLYISPYVR